LIGKGKKRTKRRDMVRLCTREEREKRNLDGKEIGIGGALILSFKI